MNRLKICILIRALPVHIQGGQEKHTISLAKALARAGNEVHIVTAAHPEKLRFIEEDNIKIHFVENTSPGKYTYSFFKKISDCVLELDKKIKFDVIHSQGFAGLRYQFVDKTRLVTTIHGTLFSETPLNPSYFSQLSFFEKLKMIYRYRMRFIILPFYKMLLRNSRRIIVDSNFTRELLLKRNSGLGNKIKVVPLGIELEEYRTLDKEKVRRELGISGFVLFTVSRLEKMKGIDVAIEVVRKLNIPDIHYYIAGKGRLEADLKEMCKKGNIKNVHFLGELSEEELKKYFAMADVFIYPEISEPAFGLVSIESMAYGTPVIASKSGAIPEVINENVGLTYERGNSIEFAKKIKLLYENPKLLNRLKSQTRRYVEENFTAEKMVERVLIIYKGIS